MRETVEAGQPMAFYGILVDDRRLAGAGEYGGRCLVPGRMWDVGCFPALTRRRREMADVVHARLWTPPADEPGRRAAVRMLDKIEGYTGDPVSSMYMRRWVELARPAGAWAWIYEWNYEMDHLRRVPGGDWRAWTGLPWPER